MDILSFRGSLQGEDKARWNVIIDGLIKPTCDGAALEGARDVRVRQAVDERRIQCLGQADRCRIMSLHATRPLRSGLANVNRLEFAVTVVPIRDAKVYVTKRDYR